MIASREAEGLEAANSTELALTDDEANHHSTGLPTDGEEKSSAENVDGAVMNVEYDSAEPLFRLCCRTLDEFKMLKSLYKKTRAKPYVFPLLASPPFLVDFFPSTLLLLCEFVRCTSEVDLFQQLGLLEDELVEKDKKNQDRKTRDEIKQKKAKQSAEMPRKRSARLQVRCDCVHAVAFLHAIVLLLLNIANYIFFGWLSFDCPSF